MKIQFDDKKFISDMNNLVEYSAGFLEGVEKGKPNLLKAMGSQIIEVMKSYVDAHARSNPETLHHVYEWYMTGSPEARLFDLGYKIYRGGLSFDYTFSQSKSVQNGSNTPFYNKAKVMENGIPVQISPVNTNFLKFKGDAGEDIFTSKTITVNNPGGSEVEGSLERVLESFFDQYYTQSFLISSGLETYLKNPLTYRKNLSRGIKFGKTIGVQTGYNWISNTKIGGVE